VVSNVSKCKFVLVQPHEGPPIGTDRTYPLSSQCAARCLAAVGSAMVPVLLLASIPTIMVGAPGLVRAGGEAGLSGQEPTGRRGRLRPPLVPFRLSPFFAGTSTVVSSPFKLPKATLWPIMLLKATKPSVV
jgi:hypothetical protein